MKKSSRLRAALNPIPSFALLGLLMAPLWACATETEGLVMLTKGSVTLISKAGASATAKIGNKVHEGDSIKTGPDSRAKVVMSDKNVLNISPDTQMLIEKYRNDANEKNVDLKVSQGKVRASVEQKYDGEKSQFNVHTPTAVAGVRGTDFIASYDPVHKVSEVVTFHGVVSVMQNLGGGQFSKPVPVGAGQTTKISPGKTAPEVPKAVPALQLQQLNTQSSAESASSGKGSMGSRDPASAIGANTSNANTGSGASSNTSNSKPPVMVSSQDLSPDLAKTVNLVPPPTGTSVGIKPPVIAPPLPPASTFLNNAVGGGGTATLNVIIVPH